jgi:hypothetical protein
MILSKSQIKNIQVELDRFDRNDAWTMVEFHESDLCETALHLHEEIDNLNELNRSLLKGLERTKAERLKLESAIRKSTETINRLALENTDLKKRSLAALADITS